MIKHSGINGISVVIPNYNGSELLLRIIPAALTALQSSGLPSEIIIADDCSIDNTANILHEQFPGIRFIQNKINKGFSATANNGIRSAKYNWVLLINSDVILESDYFKTLIKYTERENVLGVMGRIKRWEDEQILDTAKFPRFQLSKIKTSGNYFFAEEELMCDGLNTFYISGANAFINKNIFLSLGGFNELFSPFYAEDTELSLRAWRLGFYCMYEHHAVCRHQPTSTIKKTYSKKEINVIYNRNKMFLHAIHLDGMARVVWLIQMPLEVILQTVLLKFSYTRAFISFLKKYNLVKQSRQELKYLKNGTELLSVNKVFNKIKGNIKGKKIIRFSK